MYIIRIICLLICFLSQNIHSETISSSSPVQKDGKSIYVYGINAMGKDIIATGAAGTKLKGVEAACANCHRHSGFGTSEGGLLVPEITANSLFNSREFTYKELKKKTNRPITRKAYDKTSLIKAIRDGIDSNGRELNSLMPRYNMNINDMEKLTSYLSTLGKNISPGVDNDVIHFSTIITPDAEIKETSAMLAVLNAFFKSKNSESRHETRRATNSPWHKKWVYSAYRKWKLHVWRLEGPQITWGKQLELLYNKIPVFAVLSGIGTQSWQPIHDFCNNFEIPCLFPNTMLPGVSSSIMEKKNSYSIYFSKGKKLEAQVIAKHLSNKKAPTPCQNLTQIIDGNIDTSIAAKELIFELASLEIIPQTTTILKNNPQLEENIKNSLPTTTTNCLVIWANIPALNNNIYNSQKFERVYITSHQHNVGDLNNIIKSNANVYYSSLFALPKDRKIHLRRIKMWSKMNKISPYIEDISANTYFAVTMLGGGIKHIRNNFSRDYFIERLEHMIDNSAFHSVYKRFSLGPGQRYVSKGGYIIGPVKDILETNNSNNTEWIIP